MSQPYEDYASDMRHEWNDAYEDRLAEQRAEIQEARVDEWWERWGCRECETKKVTLCPCNHEEETESTYCPACHYTGLVPCEGCDGKGHHYRGR